jgi:hypothetical protein
LALVLNVSIQHTSEFGSQKEKENGVAIEYVMVS